VAPGDGPPFGVAMVPDPDGLRVHEVMPGSRAEQSGLEAGDLVTAIDSTAVKDIPPGEMRDTLTRAGAMLTVRRGEESLDLRVR
jgi:C-terminal processing protease CtpA/Prc